ncbi:MAG: helix-turn-helix transcriptional regulator [Syntrophomonas sp.]
MLGQNLKKLREVRKIAQKNLADMLGVGISTVAGWERDYRNPDLEMLVKLADFYDVSVDSLLGRQDFDVKVDIDSDRIKYKSEVEKLGDEITHSISQAVTDGILTEAQARISLQACQHIMALMIESNQEK